MRKVESFVKEKGFEDKTGLFQRAAVLAQNPKEFETMSELTEADKEIIRRETTRSYQFRIQVSERLTLAIHQ